MLLKNAFNNLMGGTVVDRGYCKRSILIAQHLFVRSFIGDRGIRSLARVGVPIKMWGDDGALSQLVLCFDISFVIYLKFDILMAITATSPLKFLNVHRLDFHTFSAMSPL